MKKTIFHTLLIITVGFLAYSNTLHVPFHFDDNPNIVETPIIKDLSYFSEPSSAAGFRLHDDFKSRFIGYLSFALNYQLHGLDVTGYHIVNLAIHISNALLVYWLVLLTFSTPYFANRQDSAPRSDNNARHASLIALFSALLFVSHPIQTQAVTYIVQRFASLATLFYLLSLVSYVKGRLLGFPTPNVKPVLWYLASLISAVLAMKTKEIAFTLPVIVTLYEFMFFEGTIKKRVLWLIPLLLTMLIIPLSLVSVDKPIGEIIGDVDDATRLQSALSRSDYLFTQFRVIVTYIRLIFLPVNQNLDYDYVVYHSFFEPAVFLSFLFLLSMFGLGMYLLYRSRHAASAFRCTAFGIFWFFITLSVESSIIPIADVIFEHRVYLPSVGAFIALTGFGELIKRSHGIEYFLTACLALIVISLTGVTYARNLLWHSQTSIWEDSAKKSPNKWRPHHNLGVNYGKNYRTEEALIEYQKAIKLNPKYAMAHNNLGILYFNQNQMDDAIREYEIALELNPNLTIAHYNLGNVYAKQRRYEEALSEYFSAAKINPYDADAHANIGIIFLKQDRVRDALKAFQTAVRLNDHYTYGHYLLGDLYAEQGCIDDAIREYQIVLQHDPGMAEVRNKIHSLSKTSQQMIRPCQY